MKKLVIAIDGPAGSGKSTIGRELAKQLGINYFSTGALYRALGLKCIQLGLDAKSPKNAEFIAKNTHLDIKFVGSEQHVLLDGIDVSSDLYKAEVSDFASQISVHPIIRHKMVELQKSIAEKNSIVMDGRDIGSVVLPNADLKFYLDADVKVRAKRRYDELVAKGQNVSFENVLDEMIERDRRDKEREVSPLIVCKDAHIIDCSNLNIQQVVDKFVEIIKRENKA